MKYIKANSTRREFGKEITHIGSGSNSIKRNTIDISKRQSLSKDNIKVRNILLRSQRNEISYLKNSSECHKNNYSNIANPLIISEANPNSTKSKSLKQSQELNRKAITKRTIETLISQKSNSIKNSINVFAFSDNDSIKNSIKTSNSNSNSTSNYIRKRNNPNNISPTIGYTISQRKDSLYQ